MKPRYLTSLFLIAFACQFAHAATYQWDGNDITTGYNGNGNWTDAKWDLVGTLPDDGTAAPDAFGATTDTAQFTGGTTATTVTLDASATVGSLSIAGPSNATTAVTLNSDASLHTLTTGSVSFGNYVNGHTLTLSTTNGGVMAVTNSGNLTLQSASTLTLNSGASWTQSGGTMRVQSNFGLGVTVNVNTGATFTYSGSNVINLSSDLNSNVSAGGSGILNLSGGTFFTGKNFNNSGSTSGGSANVNFSSGGTLKLTADITSTALFTTSGTSGGGTVFNVKVGTGGGIIDTDGFSTSITQGIANVTSQTGSLTKQGAGTLTLSGASTYTGSTSVTGGTLTLANSLALQNSTLATGGTGLVLDSSVVPHAFTFGGLGGSTALSLLDNAVTPNAVALTVGGNNATTTYTGVLSGSGSLNKTGTGTLNLTGTSDNTYSGGTVVSAGILAMNSGDSTSRNPYGTGTLTVASGATLQQGNSVCTFAGTTFLSGSGAAGTNGALVGGTGWDYSNFSAPIVLNANATIGIQQNFDKNIFTVHGTINLGSNTLTLNPATSLNTFGPRLVGVISGTGGIMQSTTGFSQLSGANTYTGATTITAGTLQAGVATVGGASPTSGPFGVNSAITVGTGAALDLNGFNQTLGSITGSGTITSNSTGTPTVTIGGDNSSQTFSGVIQNGSATSVALTKIGTGTLTLTGANTYTGNTTVNGGILSLAAANLADSSSVTVATGATLDLNFSGTDRVTALSINGTALPAGTYNSTTHPGSITGSGRIAVGDGGYSFTSWAAGLGLSGDPKADFDLDGIQDGVEFVLGTDPKVTTTSSGIQTQKSGNNLTVTFNRVDSSETSDITLVVEAGENLITWSQIFQAADTTEHSTPGVVITENDTAPDTIVVTIPTNGSPKLFARVRVIVSF